MARSRDLFDDTTMTFGEHLEVLRVHVFRALLGLVIAVSVTLFFGDRIFMWLRAPIETALRERGIDKDTIKFDAPKESFYSYLIGMFSKKEAPPEPAPEELGRDQLRVWIEKRELLKKSKIKKIKK